MKKIYYLFGRPVYIDAEGNINYFPRGRILGSGRFLEPCKMMRVPLSFIPIIKDMMSKRLDEIRQQDAARRADPLYTSPEILQILKERK